MALTNARDILNKKILGTGGGGVPSADEIPIDIPGLSATKLSVGLEEIVLDIGQLSTSVLTVKGSVETISEKVEDATTYSTDEHVVGKWIDGSDVYEKTLFLENVTLAQSPSYQIDVESLNIDKIVDFELMPYDGDSEYMNRFFLNLSSNKKTISIGALFSFSVQGNHYLTLKYIKAAPVETKKRTTKKK